MIQTFEDIAAGLDPETLDKIMTEPLAWAETFLVIPATSQPFKANYVQHQIFGSKKRYNAIRCHRRAGKCQLASDLITLSNGRRVPAGDLIGKSFEVLTLTPEGVRGVPAFAEFNAVEPVFTVTTQSGRRITRNAAHPLYVAGIQSTRGVPTISPSGWVAVRDLKVGDLVAVPTCLPCSGFRTMPEDEVKVLAYLIGDGGCAHGGVVFSQQKNAQLTEFEQCANRLGCELHQCQTAYDYRVSTSGCMGYRVKGGNPIINLLREHGVMGKHSRDKRVPEAIFELVSDQIALFLSRLYATDGWACVHKGHGADEIGYCSASSGLILDVQELLLRFGVCATAYARRDVNAWCLSIRDSREMLTFIERIGIYGKEVAVEAVRQSAERKASWTTRRGTEVIPEGDGAYLKRWVGASGRVRQVRHTPWRLKHAPPGTRWEKVRSIEAAGVQPTVAITVPRYHTYLTTFYEHNTISFAILALYYALMYPNTQVLIICPTGSHVSEIFLALRDFIKVNDWIAPYIDVDRMSNPQRISFTKGGRITGFTTAAKSKGKGLSLRGQGADIILIDEAAYLNEEDWPAINPILQGDPNRRWPPKVYVAGTPAYTRGVYYKLCTDLEWAEKRGIAQIHVPISRNPSVTAEFVAECRLSCSSELEWQKEYEAEFPSIGEGVFPKSMVDAAQRQFDYQENKRLASMEDRREKAPSRTIGVDWDKFNPDGHGPNMVVLEAQPNNTYRLIYREEVPQSRFTLKEGVRRVIELNEIFRPEWIYVDKGLGEAQIEELQLHGKQFPQSNLMERTVGVSFSSTINCPLPSGKQEKRRFKQVMISLLRTWFEQNRIELPSGDAELYQHLLAFHVIGHSDTNLKFSHEDSHAIMALGMGAMAMHQKVKNPYAPKRANRCVKVPLPEPGVKPRYVRTANGEWRVTTEPAQTFSRRALGDAPPLRRTGFPGGAVSEEFPERTKEGFPIRHRGW